MAGGLTIVALVHILFGAPWVGATVSFDLVVMSTIRRLRNPRGEPLEMEIPLMEKASKFFFPVAIITIASGLVFLYMLTAGDLLSLPRTLGGAILTLGIFLGAVVFIMGIYLGVTSSRVYKMFGNMKRAKASQRIDPEGESTMIAKKAERIKKVSEIEMILMVLTVIFMILSVYI
jgi:uncharacterized membrane protein